MEIIGTWNKLKYIDSKNYPKYLICVIRMHYNQNCVQQVVNEVKVC